MSFFVPHFLKREKLMKTKAMQAVARKWKPALLALVVLAFAAAGGAVLGYKKGLKEGFLRASNFTIKSGVKVSPEFELGLNQALEDLRYGSSERAVQTLAELNKKNPGVSSVCYLLALAAMQAGDKDLAEKCAMESVGKNEKVSDSLALLAVLATQRGGGKSLSLIDPKIQAEQFLRQSILADAANPAPYIELASLLRYQGKNQEALGLMKAAKARLNPVDSHLVVDVTIGLLALQKLSDEEIAGISKDAEQEMHPLVQAYIAMRKGDFSQAAEILEKTKKRMAADVFDYLINDPAMRLFAQEPSLRGYY